MLLAGVYVFVAQWIERLVAVQKVVGSIPAEDTLEDFPPWKVFFSAKIRIKYIEPRLPTKGE